MVVNSLGDVCSYGITGIRLLSGDLQERWSCYQLVSKVSSILRYGWWSTLWVMSVPMA